MHDTCSFVAASSRLRLRALDHRDIEEVGR